MQTCTCTYSFASVLSGLTRDLAVSIGPSFATEGKKRLINVEIDYHAVLQAVLNSKYLKVIIVCRYIFL